MIYKAHRHICACAGTYADAGPQSPLTLFQNAIQHERRHCKTEKVSACSIASLINNKFVIGNQKLRVHPICLLYNIYIEVWHYVVITTENYKHLIVNVQKWQMGGTYISVHLSPKPLNCDSGGMQVYQINLRA